jgi:aspartate-semialdehyde dehydrogenase
MATNKKLRVALIGTDSLRGKEIKTILGAKKLPLSSIEFFDTDVQEEYGKLTEFEGEPRVIHRPSAAALEGTDLVFLAADRETSLLFGRLAAEKGYQAIDLTGAFSDRDEIPLIVAGVNDSLLAASRPPLIANPHPVTIILSSLLHRFIPKLGIVKAVAFVLQPVSAFNQSGIEELASQSAAMLSGASPSKEVFRDQIAFNILSHTESPDANGFSSGERQVIAEVKRVLGRPDLPLSLSVIQAPVFHTYSIMAYLEPAAETNIQDLERLFKESPLFKIGPRSAACAVTCLSVAGKEQIFIGQIKKEESLPNSYWIWTITDNLTRGSALNALEIARAVNGSQRGERAPR